MIYTFWEGQMPGYIKLCLETWTMPYVILNYSNLHNYTDFVVTPKLTQYTLPMIADCVRVHVLRDQGGYWLDADTIILGDLPKENITGDPLTRTNSIGLLNTEKGSDMFKAWADYQDNILKGNYPYRWDLFGNAFTDEYIKTHNEITIHPIEDYQPERALIGKSRSEKYIRFYFENSDHLKDIKCDLLMLHNSWTPSEYSRLTETEVLRKNCTMSNILKEILEAEE